MAVLRVPRLLVAGVQSGVGKTTVALGLMRALARKGLRVQPFKIGPDYIDPTYHTAAAGQVSRNLDGWMGGRSLMRHLFARAAGSADLAIVEGVMGLFDGAGPDSDAGSTAEAAKWLDTPVVLVVDAGGMARSAAAVVQGYAGSNPALRLAGVVFNRVGGEGHYRLLQESLARYTRVPALGYLPRRSAIRAPERHLGLVPILDQSALAPYLDQVADLVEATVDLATILRLAQEAGPVDTTEDKSPFPAAPQPTCCRIGVARDAAFHFYYQDGLDLLTNLGAELAFFSPLAGDALPPDMDALYIGGGFPEVYRQELSAHQGLQLQIGQAYGYGLPIYAECGGLMYLSRAIVDLDGRNWPMAGLLPVAVRMQPRLAVLGYARATMLQPTLLGPAGAEVTGHEFHWSVADSPPTDWPPAYRLEGRRPPARLEGFTRGHLLASYLHVHFAANPDGARHLVAAARAHRQARQSVGRRRNQNSCGER
ncbi:MAG: cobyrinate a,c-diamide synthase [Firmicutes bacterium]|nr:cobyrinate a,c-diamide synthase [Bacillota bacterium]